MLDGKDIARDVGKRGGRPLKNKTKVTVIKYRVREEGYHDPLRS